MNNIICIAGPTASGKTALAATLAKELNGEVVSCDSMQVYKRMDIGTAKPTLEEMQGIPHHMIDVAEPWEDFSVSRYCDMAAPIVDNILSRGKTAVIAGGTGLYMDSLIRGNAFAPFLVENYENVYIVDYRYIKNVDRRSLTQMVDKYKIDDVLFVNNVSAVRNDKHAGGDSFGLVALCSIGPILTVLLLGLLYKPDGSSYTPVTVPDAQDTVEMFRSYTHALPEYFKEILVSLAPIAGFFLIFQLLTRRLNRRQVMSMIVGFLYTYLGLALFLTGVNVGFMPVGNFLGQSIASLECSWVLIPIAMVIGYFIVAAEPAVHILNRQVEEITAGSIPASAMNLALSIGVSVSLALAMIRVLTGISIMWFLLPGYALSLILSFVVPKIFTSIAFDSGGVASGPMTATFLLPFAMGACDALGGNVVTDAFGVVAMVAMTPLVTIQLLGVSYKRRIKHTAPVAVAEVEEIIELA